MFLILNTKLHTICKGINHLIKLTENKYVTGPAKIGHVGTNYTLSQSRSYLTNGIENLHSLT